MIERAFVYVPRTQWILETPTSVGNGKRYDACHNLAAALAQIGNVEHSIFTSERINLAVMELLVVCMLQLELFQTALMQWLTKMLE